MSVVLGSVHTENRGGTLKPVIEVPYTAMRGRLFQCKKVICSLGIETLDLYGEIFSLDKDALYKTVGLKVSIDTDPAGWGKAIAWIPILGWFWAILSFSEPVSLRTFDLGKQVQVEQSIVCPVLSRLGELLKSTSPQPSSA